MGQEEGFGLGWFKYFSELLDEVSSVKDVQSMHWGLKRCWIGRPLMNFSKLC